MTWPHRRPLRLGTRGSPLALAQAGQIARQLRDQCGRPAVLVTVATPGDESTAPIERLGTTGVFTTTLREALLRGHVDLAVHSGLDAGCSAPVGALAELTTEAGDNGAEEEEPAVRVSGVIAAPDGSSVIRAQLTGPVCDGDALGRRLANILLEHGGSALLDRTWRGVCARAFS
jgi:porphobilinogen deaminase